MRRSQIWVASNKLMTKSSILIEIFQIIFFPQNEIDIEIFFFAYNIRNRIYSIDAVFGWFNEKVYSILAFENHNTFFIYKLN